MRPLLSTLAIVLIGVSLATGEEPRLLENEPVSRVTLRSWILDIHEMPCGEPYLTGGYYAVADVARSAANDIVHSLPTLTLIAPLDSPRDDGSTGR